MSVAGVQLTASPPPHSLSLPVSLFLSPSVFVSLPLSVSLFVSPLCLNKGRMTVSMTSSLSLLSVRGGCQHENGGCLSLTAPELLEFDTVGNKALFCSVTHIHALRGLKESE